jgi:7-cyano-7-deazaguanine synthase
MFEAGIEASEKVIDIITPLIYYSKSEIVKIGASLEGCMEALAYSHTCYNGQVPPCGECNSCILRAKGFEEAGIKDPLIERLTNA